MDSRVLCVLSDVRLVALPRHARADGEVVVAETGAHVPFAIARMFVLRAPAGAKRGQHAHRRCSQFMICVSGAVEIECDDGESRRSFTMDSADRGLLVPPGIWASLRFSADAVVSVLCDRLYEAEDYIRAYDEFLALRKRGAL